MNVTLCSSFRNATPYLGRYLCQFWQLFLCLKKRGDSLSFVWGEGDSTDGTSEYLPEWVRDLAGPLFSVNGTLVNCTHGGPEFGSVVDAQRFRQLAYVWGRIWQHIPGNADVILYVESDLTWSASAIIKLIDHLAEYPAISPMIMLEREGFDRGAFWDTWAFRKGGKHFTQYPPYHQDYNLHKPFMVDSAGSCMALRAGLANQLVWNNGVFPDICSQIYSLGYSVWVDPTLSIVHG